MIENRVYYILGFFLLMGLVFLAKLFTIQVLDPNYKLAAESNVVQKVIEYPYRGLIYDRNGKLIVQNSPAFDLQVIPKEVKLKDTLAFCDLLGIDKATFNKKMADAKAYSYVKPSVFYKQLSLEEFARIQDKLIDFKGFSIQARTARSYNYASLANALGYIGEISKTRLNADTTTYYRQGDYIGISGLESKYEPMLRGKRGVQYKLVNVRGIEKGRFKNGQYDTLSIPGEDLHLTIDLELQQYAEKLMQGKTGSVVAIEPSTGEILTFVSSPTYDPNVLSGRSFGKNFSALQTDSLVPLFNRPLMAMYRPGSIFKIAQALTAMQEGVISPYTRIPCNRSIISCHGSHSNEDLKGAITHSCNPYFVNVSRRVMNQNLSKDPFEDTRLGLERWRGHITSLGFGSTIGIDLPNEKGGLIPSPAYYDRAYNNRPWKYSNIMSIAIGEGENLVVPLQMANFTSIIANRGYYYRPHLVKGIGESKEPLPEYQEKIYTTIDREHFDVVVEAMAEVIRSGTGQYRAKLADIEVCGKTGTVQNRDKEDHSVFIAFAPKDDPKIALAVYVEYAGQGARAAAGITGLMIEKYLKGTTDRPHMEDYILKGRFIY